ncbi:MAG: NADH-quinone oxidoreductase subunit H [Omnitrophica bacterium RIFCSPHIGHO2_02_FULL_63_14]|nr:MAG: NADH-quinone oxidoreductase subunit H [Omnitrophica bacterium RIFCSPHIGHO2_02_FULL_63_14]
MLEQTLKIVLYGTFVTLFVAVNALFLVWMERRVSAAIQLRRGPIHVGPQGLLQTLADAVKLLSKELVLPKESDRFLYRLAPLLVFAPILSAFLILPIGPGLIIRDLNVGFLFVFSLSNISFIGIFIAGWSSNNKYALLGSMRAVAQNISYEIPLLLSTMGVVMIAGTLRMTGLVAAQEGLWFAVLQPVAFLIFLTAALAEANRAPFDIPEAESELVAGFHTEYSGMRFALFFLGEYTAIFVSSAIAVTLFMGGWRGPFLPGPVWFLLKTYLVVFVIMWVRWTFPRLRSDQLMNFAWKVLIPVALANVLVTAAALTFGAARV